MNVETDKNKNNNNKNNKNSFISVIFTTTKWVYEITSIYLLWIILHYFAGVLYYEYCTPLTFSGFIMSPFLVAAPHCRSLRWVISNGGDIIINMWVIFGTWVGAKLCGSLLDKTVN
jgi:hypothetical protein